MYLSQYMYTASFNYLEYPFADLLFRFIPTVLPIIAQPTLETLALASFDWVHAFSILRSACR